MTNSSQPSGLPVKLIIGFLVGYLVSIVLPVSKITSVARNIVNGQNTSSILNSLQEKGEEFELTSEIIDIKLRQEIQGLLLSNSHLNNQIIQYDNQENLLKGEVGNVHKRLVETGEALTQKEYETVLMSQCVVDLSVAINVLDSLSDDIMERNVTGIATGLVASPQPLQQAVTSWRFGTCSSASDLAESYQQAGKLYQNGQTNPL